MTSYPTEPLSGDERVPIGIIGGSGLYDIDGLDAVETREIETPFGEPSAPVEIGELEGRRVAFLPRHGNAHQYSPTQVPYRANIWALKRLGVFWVMTASAVGSLRKSIEPGDIVIPDQVIDKTTQRANTLYDNLAVHVNLGRPYHPMLREVLFEAGREVVGNTDQSIHDGATYVCMEGPAFSTKAESYMHRGWGADLVGMTAMPEARFAREAQMCYATIAMPSDYDVWRDDVPGVDVDDVMAILNRSTSLARDILSRAIPRIPLEEESECDASSALQTAIMTRPEAISEETRRELAIFLNDYL